MKKYILVLLCLVVIFVLLYHENTHKDKAVKIKAASTNTAKKLYAKYLFIKTRDTKAFVYIKMVNAVTKINNV